MYFRALIPILLASALAACATKPAADPVTASKEPAGPAPGEERSSRGPAQSGDDKFALYLKQCRASYADVDARIAKAGVHDAEYQLVPGFPYVRTDRLMSSYRRQVSGDINTLGTWMLQLRENDSIARDIELTNMGMPKYERADLLNTLRTCAVWLSYGELADPPTLERLLDAAKIPEEQPATQATPAIAGALAKRRARIVAQFKEPLAGAATMPLTLWQVTPPPDDPNLPREFSQTPRDELGRIGLLMNQWPELAASHAPKILLETAADYDRIGSPILTRDGPSVDTDKPVVYYLPSYARVGKRTLVQLNYFIWFSASAPQRDGDPEAGALDGLIWRVTLGDDGAPLLYDTIGAAGFEHEWFPRSALRPRAGAAEPALIPQAKLPHGDFAIPLSSGTHALRRLIALKSAAHAESRRYELRPYEDLMTLAAPEGGTRSLFGPDGVVSGSQRRGVPALAMRQWGNHPTSASARRYFDDPHLIEELFEEPRRAGSVERAGVAGN